MFLHSIFVIVLCLVQSVTSLEQRVSSAFKGSDQRSLVSVFSDRTEVVLPGQSGVFSKNQAEQVFKTFFNHHKIKTFSILHRTKESDQDHFMIAQIMDEQSQMYVVQIHFYQVSSQWVVRKIAIQES